MDQPIVFVNVGWMVSYRGTRGDPTLGGHAYLREHNSGYEAWNFKPVNGRLFGYVPRSAKIQLQRLASPRGAPSVSDVTVVWIARSPSTGRTYVVGWYRSATVHRDNRHHVVDRDGQMVEYQIDAPANLAKLLPPDQRVLQVPTAKVKGNLGQSPVWYGNEGFLAQVRQYLANNGVIHRAPVLGAPPRQNDPLLRQRVERAAIEHATSYYRSAVGGSRVVVSVEKDNVGWDLDVTTDDVTLRVEVKGLSGPDLCAELTPNEYAQMTSRAHRRSYVVYVVCSALSATPLAHVFYYNADLSSNEKLVWSTAEGRLLRVAELVGARLT